MIFENSEICSIFEFHFRDSSGKRRGQRPQETRMALKRPCMKVKVELHIWVLSTEVVTVLSICSLEIECCIFVCLRWKFERISFRSSGVVTEVKIRHGKMEKVELKTCLKVKISSNHSCLPAIQTQRNRCYKNFFSTLDFFRFVGLNANGKFNGAPFFGGVKIKKSTGSDFPPSTSVHNLVRSVKRFTGLRAQNRPTGRNW